MFETCEGSAVFSFNQKNETECDYFGVGYAHGAGFEICASVSLWNRMSQLEEYDELSDLLSSHPYSQKRSDCCKKHIQNNYSLNCP